MAQSIFSNVSYDNMDYEFFDLNIALFYASNHEFYDVLYDVELDSPIEIVFNFDMSGKYNPTIIRAHGDKVERLKRLFEKPSGTFTDGTFFVDSAANEIHLYSSKFSLYSVAYSLVPADDEYVSGDMQSISSQGSSVQDGSSVKWFIEIDSGKSERSGKTSQLEHTIVAGKGSSRVYYVINDKGCAAYLMPKLKKNARSITVPDAIAHGKKKYKVTEIASHAFIDHEKLKYVRIGKNVKNIHEMAFAETGRLSVIYLTTGKLTTAGSVRGCFRKSNIKKVFLEKAAAGKYKLYKNRIITKENTGAGRKLKITKN